MAEKDDSRELVLAPNESCCILDKTNGQVYLYVGPKQDSLAPSVQPVLFSEKTKTFDRCDLGKAVQRMTIAPEGWYAVLKNPAKSGKHPEMGNKAPMPELETGRKINIPGPASFALWPGQMAKVLPGHRLRSNQYLLVRVYDQVSARANWEKAIIEKADEEDEAESDSDVQADKLTTGQLIVIRGTNTSFFIPPTGLEVVSDAEGNLVREAVTLERLDYALLLGENGSKKFVRGPAVVFPQPTEVYVTREEDGVETRKFRSIELNETSGIYVKVIADYEDGGKQYKAGEEIFITGTGDNEKLYFPREEHALIKYGDHEVHYATAIPAGEGRYVLERLKGNVKLVKGPAMYLPDPRSEVFARRILDQKLCGLLYPGNAEALAYNKQLQGALAAEEAAVGAPLTRGMASAILYGAVAAPAAASLDAHYLVSNSAEDRGLGGLSAKGFTGDGIDRKGRYTEPRTVTLNTKYQGAVTTDIWTGYAIKLVKKSGEQRVEVGPKSVMFEYDEVPQILKLSTGKPKNADALYHTGFLQIFANKVSDIIDIETIDYCKMQLKLSYRVNFEGDPNKWFNLENYVKLLCDHMRSRLRASAKKIGVEPFYQSAVEVVRDVVLGTKDGDRARPGTTFVENGMHVYDVEVLEVKILDANVEGLLVKAQRDAISQMLDLGSKRRTLDFTRESEQLVREIEVAKAETRFALLTLKQTEIGKSLAADLVGIDAKAKLAAESHKAEIAIQNGTSEIAAIELARGKADVEQEIAFEQKRQETRLLELSAEVEAIVKKAGAISPDLIAAIGAFGERALIEKLSESMAPMAILGGSSITDVVKKLLEGTKLAQYIQVPQNGNGAPAGSSKALPSAT
jgi:major vault protein